MVNEITVATRITEVAEKTFLSLGFNRVSMDDLASELGMSKKTLYAHFESKEALLRAVLERRVARISAEFEAVLNQPDPFGVKFHNVFALLHHRLGEISPLFMNDLRRYAPECFTIIDEARARMIPKHFGRLLEEGIASGHLRNDLDVQLLVRMLVAVVQNVVRPELMAEMQLMPGAILEKILNLFFLGILSDQGRRTTADVFKP